MKSRNYIFGPFEFDQQRQVLLKHGAAVSVGHKCLILLDTLLAADGRAVSKSDLITAAWASDNIEESNLAVQIAALRKVLGTTKLGDEWITTVQRVGYQFKALDIPYEKLDPSKEKPTVAVLPFINLSSDPEQEYFSDGVTSDIITELSRWRMLSILSQAATFRYRNGGIDIKQIGADLQARYVVEGSVRRLGERLRIAVQLIDVETGNHVWAENFDRQLADIFEVQDQVVRTIVSTLVGRVFVADVERAKRKPPNSLAAYECVLKGNALSWDDLVSAQEATRLFTQAVEIDPNYALAHAFLAFVHISLWGKDTSDSNALLVEAHQFAKRAVELDNNEGTCFSVLAIACVFLKYFDTALQHIHRAIELNPNNQWNTADMGIVQTYLGQTESALASFKRAKEIDPYFAPRWYFVCRGLAHMLQNELNEALATFALSPGQSYGVFALSAGCHARLTNKIEAASFRGKCLELRPTFSIAQFMSKEPFKNPDDAKYIELSLRMAGLPD